MLVQKAIKEHHGVITNECTLADLRALETIPNECTIDCRQKDTRTVERGSAFFTILVGCLENLATEAQDPPACGDEWSVQVELRKGVYALEVESWSNPAHGVLDLFLNGMRVTPVNGFDFYGRRTAKHICRVAGIRVAQTAVHRLV